MLCWPWDLLILSLIKAKANVNTKDKRGATALILASMSGKESVVKELIKLNADMHIKDKKGFTALDYANKHHFSNIVELKPLSDEAYLDILRNSKNSAYKQYKALFDYSFGIELIITPEGELSIVEQSKKYNIGARGLQRCMAKILENIEKRIEVSMIIDQEVKRIMLEEFHCEKIVIEKDCEVKII